MRFLNAPHLHDTYHTIRGYAIYVLEEDLQFEIGKGIVMTVPMGFLTDFASVPRFFWRVFPPTGWYRLAAVLHDYLYTFELSRCAKVVADAVFHAAMGVLPYVTMTAYKQIERFLLYQAVSLFGRYPSRNIQLSAL